MITDVPGIRVGHASDPVGLTGVSVVLCDTPVFTLVEEPRAPVYREFPKRVRMTLTGAILGGALAVLLLVARSTTRSARALDPEGYDAVRAAFRRARA